MNPSPVISILDTVASPASGDILVPFSIDEAYARVANREKVSVPPFVHLWRHERAMVLGGRDAKLPCAAEAVKFLRNQGYQAAVRASGGAAVPLDCGVVNLSLVLSVSAHDLNPALHFESLVELIRLAIPEQGGRVRTGEVEGAYCPGSYDLSLDGLKFCGIAQRRLSRAVAVQAFVLTEGRGSSYGETARFFYGIAGEGAKASDFPHVVPERMASLHELGVGGGAAGFATRVREALAERGPVKVMTECPDWLKAETEKSREVLKARNGNVGS